MARSSSTTMMCGLWLIASLASLRLDHEEISVPRQKNISAARHLIFACASSAAPRAQKNGSQKVNARDHDRVCVKGFSGANARADAAYLLNISSVANEEELENVRKDVVADSNDQYPDRRAN